MKLSDLIAFLDKWRSEHGNEDIGDGSDLPFHFGSPPPAEPLLPPTPSMIRDEIENGPLKAVLAPYWNAVFVAPDGSEPADPERASGWRVKTQRAGKLLPDSAFDIHRLLTTPPGRSRADELGWGPFTKKDVTAAKAYKGS